MSLKVEIENICCDQKEATFGSGSEEIITQDVVVDQLYDMLACKICYEPYTEKSGNHEPKVMKCGHSICSQCISFIYNKRNAIKCPFCNCSVNAHPKTLPNNFDIISMLPHYPNLPPNQVSALAILVDDDHIRFLRLFVSQKPHNIEVEKLKVQYASEQAFVIQLTRHSEEANQLVTQAIKHLDNLRSHAAIAEKQLQQARKAKKVTEDSARLLIELRPEDPMMVALAGNN